MSHPFIRFAVVILSLAVAGLALPLAASADQLPEVAVRSAYFTGGQGTASCNSGEVAIGGGVGADVVANTYVARSQPAPQSGTPTAWNAWLRERADGSAFSSGTVYVVCARAADGAAPEVAVRSAYFTGGQGTAGCEAGEVATGGGVGADVVANTYVARSQPAPQSGTPTAWNAWLRERASGSAVSSGTVYVVCARAAASSPPATPATTTPPATTPAVTPAPLVVVQILRDVVYFPRDGAKVQHKWLALKRYTRVRKLTVRGLQRGATLVVRCRGRGCPFRRKSRVLREGGTAALAKWFAHRRLRPGTMIEVRIAAPGEVAKIVRFTMRTRRLPRVTTLCAPTGARPARC